MTVRAVLFDAAGTLIDVREPVGETYARLARAHGVTVAAQRIDRAFRGTLPHMPAMVCSDTEATTVIARERDWWREVVRRTCAAAAPAARFENFAAYFDAVFDHYAQPAAWVVAAGAHAVLAELRRGGCKTGIVSNFDHRLPALLDGLGLTPLVETVIRPADAGAAKPDARIFRVALERLGVAPADALYVGNDDVEDVRGARAAGLHAVNVSMLPQLGALVEYVKGIKERRTAS